MVHKFEHEGKGFQILAHLVGPNWWDATLAFDDMPPIRSEDDFGTEQEAVDWGVRKARDLLSQ